MGKRFDELGCKLAEAFWEWMKLIGPFVGLKGALCIDEDEVVDRIRGQVEQHLPEFDEGAMKDCGAVGLVACEFE